MSVSDKKTRACRRIFLLLILSAEWFGCASVQKSEEKTVKLYPLDESSKDASFAAFKKQLIQALKQKNAAFILNILDPNVTASFGGDGGIEEFKQSYRLNQPDSEFWKIMLTCMELGGTFGSSEKELTSFQAPYVFTKFPRGYDGYFYSAIIKKKAALRTAPDSKAPIIQYLSYDVVKIYDPKTKTSMIPENGFYKVFTLSGKVGWVAEADIRSPIDHRVIFQKNNSHWILTSLVDSD